MKRLGAKLTIKWLRPLKRQMEQDSRTSATFLALTWQVEEIISNSQLVDHLEATGNEENEINDDLYKLRALRGDQGCPKAPDPNLKRCKYNCLVEWEIGEKTY